MQLLSWPALPWPTLAVPNTAPGRTINGTIKALENDCCAMSSPRHCHCSAPMIFQETESVSFPDPLLPGLLFRGITLARTAWVFLRTRVQCFSPRPCVSGRIPKLLVHEARKLIMDFLPWCQQRPLSDMSSCPSPLLQTDQEGAEACSSWELVVACLWWKRCHCQDGGGRRIRKTFTSHMNDE